MRTPILCLALSVPLALSSCAVVAGGIAAVVISQEMMDNNTFVSQINQDVKAVWPTVKLFMAETSLEMVEIEEWAAERTTLHPRACFYQPVKLESFWSTSWSSCSFSTRRPCRRV